MRCRSVFVSALFVLLVVSAGVGYRDSVKASTPEPGSHLQNPPGFLFSSLLENITINANGGWIKIGDNVVSVFLPENASGKLVLYREDGTELVHWPWEANRGRFSVPFHTINFRNAMDKSGNQFDVTKLRLNTPGNYRFDFFMGGKRIYTFPLSIRELKPSDPFGGESKFVAIGDWNDWGYVHFAEGAGSPIVSWKLWLREWEFDQVSRSIEVELRNPSGALVAQNKVRSSVTFRHDWKRLDFELHKPKDNSLFRSTDLVKDGPYELKMTMNGKTYGIWKIGMKGGKPVTTGRAERGAADPLTFVEGGSNAFWFKRES